MKPELRECVKNIFNSGKTHATHLRTQLSKDIITSIDFVSLYSMLKVMSKDEIEEFLSSENKEERG